MWDPMILGADSEPLLFGNSPIKRTNKYEELPSVLRIGGILRMDIAFLIVVFDGSMPTLT